MNTLILSILKHFAEAAFRARFESEVPKAARHLDAAKKGFPAQPTDHDRAAFCHACSYWLLKEAGIPGSIAGAAVMGAVWFLSAVVKALGHIDG